MDFPITVQFSDVWEHGWLEHRSTIFPVPIMKWLSGVVFKFVFRIFFFLTFCYKLLKKLLFLWDTDGLNKIHLCYLAWLASYSRDTMTPFTYGCFNVNGTTYISCFQNFLQMQNRNKTKTFETLNL